MPEPSSVAAVAFVSLIDAEATMLLLGVYCAVSGLALAAGSLWSQRHRPVLEAIGGSLFLAGLGFAGADFVLVS